jgi:hypothetical protein
MQLRSLKVRLTPAQRARRERKLVRRRRRLIAVARAEGRVLAVRPGRFPSLGALLAMNRSADGAAPAPPEKKRRIRLNFRQLLAIAFNDPSKLKSKDGLALRFLRKSLHLARSS